MKTMPLTMVCALVWCVGGIAWGDVISIGPEKDNTLFGAVFDDLSSGVGAGVYAGRIGPNGEPNVLRRALMKFDVSGLPAGASITGVRLLVQVTASPNDIAYDFDLHRVLSDWGEEGSASQGGAGAPAEPGDATWFHTFWSSASWATPGGDFTAASSGMTSMATAGPYVFESEGMRDDVAYWLAHPKENFGWIVLGNEIEEKSARRLGSREEPAEASRPILEITFDAGAVPGDFNGDGVANGADLGLMLAAWNACDACPEDMNGDGTVNGADLGLFLIAWTG